MSDKKRLLSSLALCFFLMACGGGGDSAPASDNSGKATDDTVKVAENSPKIEQFLIDYNPPKEITEKVGSSAKLTYSVKVKTDNFDGDYTFFDCHDSECKTKYKKFIVTCDKKRNCQAFDASENKVGTPDHIWTFAYLWHPIYNSRTKTYDTWTGLDLHFVEPASLSDGFHDEFYAAQFEDTDGNKSELEIFHFDK